MNAATNNVIENGMNCLIEKMGLVDTERFISTIKRDDFDYTKWQREYFDRIKPGQFHDAALEYGKNHPHSGNGTPI